MNLTPPYIHNAWAIYKRKITLGDSLELNPIQEFEIRQAFFAGFTQGIGLADALEKHHSEAERTSVYGMIKDELDHFSALNRELSAKMGMPHQSLKDDRIRGF